MKKTGIIGCGWLGMHLARHLSNNHKIYTTTRSESKKSEIINQGYQSDIVIFRDDRVSQEYSPWPILKSLDYIIITIPFSKKTDTELLLNRFENLSLFLKGYNNPIFLMSSIGIYPQVEIDITENNLEIDQLHPGFLSVERFIKDKFPQVNILRLGGLMGGSRIFSKYPLTIPDQIVNHIHYEDICTIIEKMIELELTEKIYNVVAPLHPMKQEIINFQKGTDVDTSEFRAHGRKILSENLIDELNYEFLHPDPTIFH